MRTDHSETDREELTLTEAVDLFGGTPDLNRRCVAGEFEATGRWGMEGPLAAPREIHAKAWHHMFIMAPPGGEATLRTMRPEEMRIYDVRLRRSQTAPEPCSAPADVALQASVAMTVTMLDVAREIVAGDRRCAPHDYRAAFGRHGYTVPADGRTVIGVTETVDGLPKEGRAGRHPTICRLIVEARAQRVGRLRAWTPARLADDIATWLADRHPTLEHPAPKRFRQICSLCLAGLSTDAGRE